MFAYWLYPTAALLLWGYQTADAMDGRQGKRVGMYVHPSTELFDHGVDGVVTSFSGISSVALLGLGSNYWGVLHLCCLWSMFYLTTVSVCVPADVERGEDSHVCVFFLLTSTFPFFCFYLHKHTTHNTHHTTHTLQWEHITHGKITFAAGGANPTEGLIIALLTFILLGFYPHVLETTLTQAFGVQQIGNVVWLTAMPLKHGIVVSEIATVAITVLKNSWYMSTDATHLRPGLTPWICFVYFVPLCATWLMSFVLLFEQGPDRWTFVAISSCVNLAILQLIVCEMTKSKFAALAMTLSFVPGVGAVVYFGASAVPIVVCLGLLRFAGRWLNFQRELVHYTGMGSPMAVQEWPEKHPNFQRLKDKIAWLVDETVDISEGADTKRDELLIKRKHVVLLD